LAIGLLAIGLLAIGLAIDLAAEPPGDLWSLSDCIWACGWGL